VSDHEPLDGPSLHQLEQLVRHLGEELATFRRRALQAEGTLRTYEPLAKSGDPFADQRTAKLERENIDLRAKLMFATERAKGLLDQVRFLRQQAARPVSNSGADR